MLWLALDLPDLALAVHTRGQPVGESRPLAVVVEGRILTVSPVAAQAGIAPGQSTASALALCPTLRFLERLPEAEAALLAQLAEACFALTPTVVLAPPRSVLLEVGGCLKLFRGQAGLMKQVQKRLRHFGVPLRLGQAPTPKAALLLAQSPQAEASLRLPVPLPMSACLPLLQRVPLSCLPWEAELHKKLQRLQFDTLGDLMALSRPALSKRLGTAATQYLARLLGELPDPQTPLKPADTFSASLFFLDGISQVDGLLFPMKRLLTDFCQFLRQHQWSCSRFIWKLHHQDKSRQQILISSALGDPNSARFLSLTELKLEHVQLSAPIEVLTLEAIEFQVQHDTRLSLLPDPGQEDGSAIELLDRLRARLGHDACLRLSPRHEHRPEAAQKAARDFLPGDVVQLATKTRRPTWLWPEAKALRVIEDKLWWQGELELLEGPERLCLPWWEDGDTRDYYLARHSNGGHYWLYFSHNNESWFCQGLFG